MQAVIDAVEDLKRIHDFHPIEDANAIKEAAYFSFWLIKRKPMCFTGNLSEISGSSKEEIDKRKVNILFINEFCAAIYIMPKIFRLKKEVKELDKAYPNMDKLSNDWKKYFDNLIYFLSYRAESPKSIEAALTSLIMTPKWETNFDFWKVDEKNNYSKSAKWLVIGSSVVGGVVVIALILVAALLKNEVAANVASIVASILSAVLSIVAIIYTFHSNIQTDAKLKEILEMGKKMQKIETEIKLEVIPPNKRQSYKKSLGNMRKI